MPSATPAPNPPGDGQPAGGPVTEAYPLVGGTVTVRYEGSAANLVVAVPPDGFAMEIEDAGPQQVNVRFRSADHESRLSAEVVDGRPQVQPEERAR